MKHGSLRHSVKLPAESFADGYSPDGLSETDIDALLSESALDVDVNETAEHEAALFFPFPDSARSPQARPSRGEVA